MIKHTCMQREAAPQPRVRKGLRSWGSEEEQAMWYPVRFSTQPPLTRSQVHVLLERAAAGDAAARERLIGAYLPLVARLTAKYQDRGLALPDLLQEGTIGLLEAIKSFRPTYKSSFHSYVTRAIKWAMHKAVCQNLCWYKLPSELLQQIDTVNHRSNQLFQEYGCDVIDAEFAQEMGLSKEAVEQLRVVTQSPLSLERVTVEEASAPTGETLLDLLQAPSMLEDDILRGELREHVLRALLALPQRERMVLFLRYGFLGGREYTLQEIGRKLRVTRERVRQIEERALRRLHMGSFPIVPAIRLLNCLAGDC